MQFSRFDFEVDNARCSRSCRERHGVYAVSYDDGKQQFYATWELHAVPAPVVSAGYQFRLLHKHQGDGGQPCACTASPDAYAMD